MSFKKKLIGLGTVALVGLNSLLPINARANDFNLENRVNTVEIEDVKRRTHYWELGLYILGSYGLTTFMHEGGHYLTDLAFNVEDPEMNFIPRVEDESIIFASTKHKGNLSDNEQIVFDLAGVGTTRMNYEILNYCLDKNKIPNGLERFGSVLALFLRLDLPRDILWSSVRYYSRNENDYSDIHRVVEDNFNEKDVPYIYGALLLTESLDLYLDRKEIKNHFYRALGRKVNTLKYDKKRLDFNLDFNGDGFFADLEYNF